MNSIDPTHRPSIQIDFINNYALKNYEKGWDGWIESLDLKEKYRIIGINTTSRAFVLAQAWVAGWTEAEAIRAESSALYDTGEEAGDQMYKQIQDNYELQNAIASFNRDGTKMRNGVHETIHQLLDKEREAIDVK
jgi:hypothetical protein